jgi:hypothetical protein
MRKSNRFINKRRLSQTPVAPMTLGSIDCWLVRASQLAAVLAVVLAIVGYFYTVQPLYQKALLDEAIAKKEVDLKKITALYEKNYEKLKGSGIHTFVFAAGTQCTDLLEPPEPPLKFGDPLPKEIPEIDSFLKFDSPACLRKLVMKPSDSLAELKQEDFASLRQSVDEIAKKFEKKREEFALSIKGVPSLAKENPSLLAPSFLDLHLLKEIGVSSQKIKEMEFSTSIRKTQRNYRSQYFNELRRELLTLYDLSLPAERLSAK